MIYREIVHTCTNSEVARAAVKSIGGTSLAISSPRPRGASCRAAYWLLAWFGNSPTRPMKWRREASVVAGVDRPGYVGVTGRRLGCGLLEIQTSVDFQAVIFLAGGRGRGHRVRNRADRRIGHGGRQGCRDRIGYGIRGISNFVLNFDLHGPAWCGGSV